MLAEAEVDTSDDVFEESDGYPTISQMLETNPSPEWIYFLLISAVLCIYMIVLDVRAIIRHKKFSTRHPLQCQTTLGILQVYPLYGILHASGLLIPRVNEVCLYLAETYEALTFLFFLRLVLTYLGGKKSTKSILKGHQVHVNVPPLCFLCCFPSFRFTRRYFVVCEWLIYLYVIFSVVFGFIELANTLDESHGYPANVVEEDISLAYNITSLVLLVIAVYGLSGIYHSTEEHLAHRGIIRKFIIYKAFVTVAKIEDVVVGYLLSFDIINSSHDYNHVFNAALRARMIVSFVIVVEAAFCFPIALLWYGTEDYLEMKDEGNVIKNADLVVASLALAPKDGEGVERGSEGSEREESVSLEVEAKA